MTTLRACVRFTTLILILGIPAMASAQEQPTTGLVITSSGTVSLIWHVSDRVALRPELGLSGSTTEHASVGAETSQFNLSPGIGLLFYTAPREDFRVYVSPRYVYGRSKAESKAPLGSSESTLTSHTVSGSAGAEYSMHRHFAAFGELGLYYTRTKPGAAGADRQRTWGLRSAVGAIWYF